MAVALSVANAFDSASVDEDRQGTLLDRSGVVLQRNDADCGVSALLTLAHIAGIPVHELSLRADVPYHPEGASLLMLAQAAARQGIRLTAIRATEPAAAMLAVPWIAHLGGGNGHYVVVVTIDGDGVTTADPARGRVRYSTADFLARWTGYGLVIASKGRAPNALVWEGDEPSVDVGCRST